MRRISFIGGPLVAAAGVFLVHSAGVSGLQTPPGTWRTSGRSSAGRPEANRACGAVRAGGIHATVQRS